MIYTTGGKLSARFAVWPTWTAPPDSFPAIAERTAQTSPARTPSHSDRGPRGGNGHTPSTTNTPFCLPAARSHVVRDPPRIETCASTPRLRRDLGFVTHYGALDGRGEPGEGDSALRAARPDDGRVRRWIVPARQTAEAIVRSTQRLDHLVLPSPDAISGALKPIWPARTRRPTQPPTGPDRPWPTMVAR
jgi:hypothetical protein